MFYTVDYFYHLNLNFDIQSGFFDEEDEQAKTYLAGFSTQI